MKLPSFDRWLHWTTLFEGLGLTVFMLVGSAVVLTVLVLRVPADFLVRDPHAPAVAIGWLARIGKNALGVLLVIAGLIMAIPGVPGQGLLTILMGLLLVDLPGKSRFERRILARPEVLPRLNRIRGRFGKTPLVAPPDPAPRDEGDETQ